MTRDDMLRMLLAAAEDAHCVFDYAEITSWSTGEVDGFLGLGLLRAASSGLMAPCPNCPDVHVEPVECRAGPAGEQRFFIHCPESLRVEVAPEMCRGWEVDPEGLARGVTAALGLAGSPKPIVPGRLWRIGRIPWEGGTREVLLARRMGDGDGAAIASRLGPVGRSIVMTPRDIPNERIWPGRVPAVVALSRITTFDGSGLAIDGVAMAEIVVEADRAAEAAGIVAIDKAGKKLVRQQVKAEIKSLLTDDALIAAYKEHGSFRKAADSLTEQTGERVTKDKVKRAVDRHGGVDVVKPREDSASVSRRVASHARDRSKKFLERR